MAVLLLPATVQFRPPPLSAPSTDSPCWTDHPVTTDTPIKAVHVNELRREIDRQRRQVGLQPFAWTDDPVIARYTLIKAAHILELREALQAVWDRVGRGPLPAWSCGSPPSPERVVFASDVNDLRLWSGLPPSLSETASPRVIAEGGR